MRCGKLNLMSIKMITERCFCGAIHYKIEAIAYSEFGIRENSLSNCFSIVKLSIKI